MTGKSGNEKLAILLAGGGLKDPGTMVRIMSQGFTGLENPSAAYIGTANGDNPIFFQMMKTLLKKAGAGKVHFVHLAKEKPGLDAAKETLSDADIIFLAGGEVEDGMNWLTKHDLVPFLKGLYAAGKLFMGISAGVIMMGTHWVHWDIPENNDTAKLFDCMGIIPALFDVHGEEEDWIELKTALKLLGSGSRGHALPRDCTISADSRGNLINLSGDYIIFANEGGRIKIL